MTTRSPWILFALLLVSCGARRTLVVDSTPDGALVRLDEQIIGITPLEFPFEHYGHRRLSLYLEGHDTWSEPIHLETPWYSRFPLDVLTEVLLPLSPETRRSFHVDLQPTTQRVTRPDLEAFTDDAHALHEVERAEGLRLLTEELARREAEARAAWEARENQPEPGDEASPDPDAEPGDEPDGSAQPGQGIAPPTESSTEPPPEAPR